MFPAERNPFYAPPSEPESAPQTLRSGGEIPSGVRRKMESAPPSEPPSVSPPSSVEARTFVADEQDAAPMTVRTGLAPRGQSADRHVVNPLLENATPSEVKEIFQDVQRAAVFIERHLTPGSSMDPEDRLSRVYHNAKHIEQVVGDNVRDAQLQRIRSTAKEIAAIAKIALPAMKFVYAYRDAGASEGARQREQRERKKMRAAQATLQQLRVDVLEWLDRVEKSEKRVPLKRQTEVLKNPKEFFRDQDDDDQYPSRGVL